MTAQCKARNKPPIDPCVFHAKAKLWKVQRKRTASDGTSPNNRDEFDLKANANWITVGEKWFYVRPRRGRQSDVAELQLEVTTGDAFARWDAVTGSMDAGYRLARNLGSADEVVYQISGAVDWEENQEWVVYQVARIAKVEAA